MAYMAKEREGGRREGAEKKEGESDGGGEGEVEKDREKGSGRER